MRDDIIEPSEIFFYGKTTRLKINFLKKGLTLWCSLYYNYSTAVNKGGVSMANVGRPKSDNPKNRRITVKVTEAEFNKVEQVATSKGLSKSEAILKGIDLLDAEQQK